MDAVGDILAERQQDRLPWAPATVLAALLHAAVLVGLLASVFARPVHYAAPRAVAVRLLSAGSLRAPAPVQVAEPAPPAAAPKPKIEKPVVEEAPRPSKNAVLLPAKEDKKKKPTPPPVSQPGRAAAPAVSLPSANDEPTGTSTSGPAGAGGTAGISSVKLDQADFKYPFDIEQLGSRIGMYWFKPAQTDKAPVVHFQIERDGTVTDARILTSSGLPFVDRAALRAVMEASPLPPLPAEYGGPHLGIQVVFE